MRRLAILLALGLAACTDEGVNPIVGAMVEQVSPFGGDEAESVPRGQPVTRESIEASGAAVIRARLLTDELPGYYFAASENGGYVTYASQFRQTLTMRNAQVTASRGLGWDLLSATSSQPDPLVTPIPPASWPAMVTRTYEFPADSAQGEIVRYQCRFEPGEMREIAILGERRRGVEITEVCSNEGGSFENLHLVEPSTGTIWRTIQWLGPEQGQVDVEVVEPYTGR
jgi:Group 4 capsule polysaccharide lipoprotein gfcB, YjbF